MKKLTPAQRENLRAIKKIKDEDIDFSDMPEVLDWSGAEIDERVAIVHAESPPDGPVLDALVQYRASPGIATQLWLASPNASRAQRPPT